MKTIFLNFQKYSFFASKNIANIGKYSYNTFHGKIEKME